MPPTLMPGKLGKLQSHKASEENSLPSICIYGGPGIGKTTLAASAYDVPEMGPVALLNIENGAASVREVYPDLEVYDINTFQQIQDVYNDLYKHADWEAQTCAGYKTIILDNVTEGQKKGMEHIFEKDKLANQGISFTDFQMATFANGGWNISSEQMRKLIRAFRELPCYVIFVAWEMDADTKSESGHLWTPSFTAKLASEAPGMFNDVYRYYFDRDDRKLQTARTKSVVAKDRTRKLPAQLQDPTMSLVHQYWTGALVKSEEDTIQTKSTLRRK